MRCGTWVADALDAGAFEKRGVLVSLEKTLLTFTNAEAGLRVATTNVMRSKQLVLGHQ